MKNVKNKLDKNDEYYNVYKISKWLYVFIIIIGLLKFAPYLFKNEIEFLQSMHEYLMNIIDILIFFVFVAQLANTLKMIKIAETQMKQNQENIEKTIHSNDFQKQAHLHCVIEKYKNSSTGIEKEFFYRIRIYNFGNSTAYDLKFYCIRENKEEELIITKNSHTLKINTDDSISFDFYDNDFDKIVILYSDLLNKKNTFETANTKNMWIEQK
ncbi:MAG: hypothetical protein NUK62_01375 [Tenericutes bacterium]|nr:hypothetical protein [Mycoplasmatota bacterium]